MQRRNWLKLQRAPQPRCQCRVQGQPDPARSEWFASTATDAFAHCTAFGRQQTHRSAALIEVAAPALTVPLPRLLTHPCGRGCGHLQRLPRLPLAMLQPAVPATPRIPHTSAAPAPPRQCHRANVVCASPRVPLRHPIHSARCCHPAHCPPVCQPPLPVPARVRFIWQPFVMPPLPLIQPVPLLANRTDAMQNAARREGAACYA